MTLLALNMVEAVWTFIDRKVTQIMNVEFKNHLSYNVYFFYYNKKCKVHLIISQLKKSTPTQFVLYIQSFFSNIKKGFWLNKAEN